MVGVRFRPMKISVRWLNEYLQPGNVTAQEAERVLTFAGFPIESAVEVAGAGGGTDTCLDVEVTSNRGDVLSHIGVAREIAAVTGRRLVLPDSGKAGHVDGDEVGRGAGVENRVPEVCPLFTVRRITGVKVGPSPAWLVEALASVGQRSINNVVDVTNFVAFEYGQPTHVFDAARVREQGGKKALIVRRAGKGEPLTLLDGKTIKLAGDELVVADGGEAGGGVGRAISLAGVMGGSETQVTGATTDVLLEAATWDPVCVRTAARRFGIRTDASYRFERTVDARTIDAAARRAAALIVELGGGRLVPGVIVAGRGFEVPRVVRLRPERVRAILGHEVPASEMARLLRALEIGVEEAGGSLICTIPAHRPDLEREIDLIEEVARTAGLDTLPVHDKVAIRAAGPQATERGVAELCRVLTGAGFYEAITFTFVSAKAAKPFLPAGMGTLMVTDNRRSADPVLRPSVLPSLLACRRANQDAGAQGDGEGGVRLFEISSVFVEVPGSGSGSGAGSRGRGVETPTLALLADACIPAGAGGAKAFEQRQMGVRLVRGVIEAAALALGGSATKVELIPLPAGSHTPGYEAGSCAEVRINGARAGNVGLIASGVQREHDLAVPVVGAELSLASLVGLFPARSLVRELPGFPAIERDLSLIVAEETAWARVDGLVGGLKADRLEAWSFVGVFRGAQIGAGKKSVTLRLRFRDPGRTLTHDEVTPQVESVIAAAKRELGAELRTV